MKDEVTSEAFFDTLFLAQKLDNFLDGFKPEEIHLFSFFSSFLFHYAGDAIALWPHKYTVSNGYPFSITLNEAISRHIQNGLFEERGEFYSVTGKGEKELSLFIQLPTFQTREKFLSAACTTTIIIPYSQAIRALLNEPELKKIDNLQNQWLDLANVYPGFEKVSQAVGVHTKDLMIPAVSWLNYLNAKETSNN